ncbi:MAG TPA: hypothetical protein DCP63_13580 [Bacteroidetes bacterium]|nr:hypothetical protein [Bacteroidota bacterium]
MKQLLRVATLCLLALMAASVLFAQSVKVKREAMSPGRRSSGAPNYTTPAGPWYVSTGLKVVAKGMKAYFSADTVGSGATKVTSFAWTIASKPSGSTAVLDSTDKKYSSFTPDVTGQYVINVSVNGGAKTSADTIFVSTYKGSATGQDCGFCHAPGTPAKTNYESWKTSPHATMFARGITGQLENDIAMGGKGAYAASCFKCHTTGWESVTDNGNFGYLAKQSGWDTTWYKNLPFASGDYWIGYKDSTLWKGMSAGMQSTGTIGCEACHGPANDHATTADKSKVDVKTIGSGVCLQCHDAPKKHRLGSYWQASAHSNLRLSSSEASRTACYPCHNGDAFIKFANAYNAGRSTLTSADSAKITVLASITCATCHDPHGSSNPRLLRIVKRDTLFSGYKIPTGFGGKSQLCMNCHRARAKTFTQVTNQKNRFADRFYPHYSPQADMYVGSNAWEFGLNLSGLNTHGSVRDGCVTCHMSERVNGSSVHSDHEMSMEEEVNGVKVDKVEACKECHGNITRFDDIKAMLDYDGDGRIEGAISEVEGLLALLKAKLPKDPSGEPVTMARDSMAVKNHPQYPGVLGALFNYNFVTHDMSKGVHNTKYTIAILRASLGLVTGVDMDPLPIPATYDLSQNYPNPFNPTTEIRFSLPKASDVKLVIYDIMGREISTLVDKNLEAGGHRAMWNGRTAEGKVAPSGVYFYHIQAGDFTATKKMVMLK